MTAINLQFIFVKILVFREDIDQYDITHMELDSASIDKIALAVRDYREYLMEWPVLHIVDNIALSVIVAIEDALIERNSRMHLSDKPAVISKLNMEMLILVKFLDIILVPNLTKLDLKNRLQPVRNHLYENLHHLQSLQSLDLADASHGYTPHLFKKQFLRGVGSMHRIVMFTLHFDCFDDLVSCLSDNCCETVRMLDVEMSKQVTDVSIDSLVRMRKLVELNIFSCGLSHEGQAKVLGQLRNLVRLKRGDFLCEALDWLDWMKEPGCQQLILRDFYYSEDYHFHTPDQMALVSKWCPKITTVRFMFSKEHFISYQNLNVFRNIQSLHLCGGEFYSGKNTVLEGLVLLPMNTLFFR